MQKTWEAVVEAVADAETQNVKLGIGIGELKTKYFYKDLILFLKGDNSKNGNIYFDRLKPLYDKFGYEKVNRILLALEEKEEEKEEVKEEEKGEDNE